MFRKLTGLVVVCLSVVLGPAVLSSPAAGQEQAGAHVAVIPESKHDRFAPGPEDPIRASLSSTDINRQKALLRTHAPGLMRLLHDAALQSSTGPTVATTTGTDSAGVGANGYAPPDTNGAAGPTQYVQWVNVNFAVYNKSDGSLVYGPVAGNSIWSGFGGACQTYNDGDPIVQFDKQAGRWVMLQPVFHSPYAMCVAVSTSDTWTSSGMTWNRYQFAVPNSSTNFPDYPKLSVWPDGYYLSYNSFTNGASWAGPQACVMNRSAMLAGSSATMQCAPTPGTQYGSLLPADLDGAIPGVSGTTSAPPVGSPNYYLALYSNTQHTLFKFHVDWANSANSSFAGPVFINIASFNPACGGGTCVPQSGTTTKLDSLADRMMYRLAYRNFGDHESLVASHSVDPGNGTSGIRWYEIRNPGGVPTVYQQGTFAPDANFRWMPSIAQDKNGNLAVGYSESSSSMHPGIFYTGRLSSDPLNTLQSESPILQGGGSQTGGLSRWGDYSSMSIDPVDDCTFWYTNEYLIANGSFNWSTWFTSFKFPGCSTTSTPDFGLSATPSSRSVTAGGSTTYTVTASALNGYSNSVSFSATGAPAGVTVSFSPASVTPTNSTTMNVSTSASTVPGIYPLTVTGTDGTISHNTSVTLVVTSPGDFTISASPSSSSVTRGNSTTYTVTIGATGGFTGTVSLSLSGLPTKTSYSFTPTSIAGSGNSTLTVKTNRQTSRGTYNLTISGSSGSLLHSTAVTLAIN